MRRIKFDLIFSARNIFSLFLALMILEPAFAQDQSENARDIERCKKEANFDLEGFYAANDAAQRELSDPQSVASAQDENYKKLSKSTETFLGCLNATKNPSSAEIRFARGFLYLLGEDAAKGMKKAAGEFCAAAEQGYIIAQEKCAEVSHGDPEKKHRWILAAALNGSRFAQFEFSSGDFDGTKDHEINSYILSYLSCHPAMFRTPAITSSFSWPKGLTEKDFAKPKDKIGIIEFDMLKSSSKSCHQKLNSFYINRVDATTLKKWEDLARKQLAETLKNIRRQVKEYPQLANY